jgi:hypothetical protein
MVVHLGFFTVLVAIGDHYLVLPFLRNLGRMKDLGLFLDRFCSCRASHPYSTRTFTFPIGSPTRRERHAIRARCDRRDPDGTLNWHLDDPIGSIGVIKGLGGSPLQNNV